MTVLLVFESMFGNSEKVARAVAAGLATHVEVIVREAGTSTVDCLPPDLELLVVGGPTHAFSMTRPTTRQDAVRQGAGQGRADRGLREWLEGLGPDLARLPAATFDTRVTRARKLPGSAARSAARVLRRKRAHLVASPESFFVDDVAGPLGEDELTRAEAWGRRLAALLERESVRPT
jgi:hypothetical protein